VACGAGTEESGGENSHGEGEGGVVYVCSVILRCAAQAAPRRMNGPGRQRGAGGFPGLRRGEGDFRAGAAD